ncbi:MAG: hypothetical protein ACU0CC_05590 [Sagittula sp.]|jgi:hypothetical protein|uniref:hypothetical protein n=1 Tax=unclassified Sagittula TaxID=2624628 RepID=UPI0012FD5F0D|nr:hypothetical protein [Sagittula sp. MA-2]WHZ37104.1 hypothetical protein QNI11_08795 [Sagittula sp. MA-2]
MEEKLMGRSETQDMFGLPPNAPLDMPSQVLERSRPRYVPLLSRWLMWRNA